MTNEIDSFSEFYDIIIKKCYPHRITEKGKAIQKKLLLSFMSGGHLITDEKILLYVFLTQYSANITPDIFESLTDELGSVIVNIDWPTLVNHGWFERNPDYDKLFAKQYENKLKESVLT